MKITWHSHTEPPPYKTTALIAVVDEDQDVELLRLMGEIHMEHNGQFVPEGGGEPAIGEFYWLAEDDLIAALHAQRCETMQRLKRECGCPDCGRSLVQVEGEKA